MSNQPFDAHLRRDNDKVILDLQGVINASAETRLNDMYSEAESLGGQDVYLNFSEVTYINSTGIALIVSLLARARKSHHTISVYGLSEHYHEIFQITRLSDFMNIYPDEATAVKV